MSKKHKKKKTASGGKQLCFAPSIRIICTPECNRNDVIREYKKRAEELFEAWGRDARESVKERGVRIERLFCQDGN